MVAVKKQPQPQSRPSLALPQPLRKADGRSNDGLDIAQPMFWKRRSRKRSGEWLVYNLLGVIHIQVEGGISY